VSSIPSPLIPLHQGGGFVAQALQPVLDIRNSLERLFHIVFLFFCDLLTLRFAGVSVRRKGAFYLGSPLVPVLWDGGIPLLFPLNKGDSPPPYHLHQGGGVIARSNGEWVL